MTSEDQIILVGTLSGIAVLLLVFIYALRWWTWRCMRGQMRLARWRHKMLTRTRALSENWRDLPILPWD